MPTCFLPRLALCGGLLAWLSTAGAFAASSLTAPHLHLAPAPVGAPPRVALTLDACGGRVDDRILQFLVSHHIKATIFATARWLARNPAAVEALRSHPGLFRVENHGAHHVAAVLTPGHVFGVRTAGSAAALRQEIEGGAAAVTAAMGRAPQWFRGATAEYSSDALHEIDALGEHVAGFSLLGDGGAMFTAQHAAHAVAAAEDGDVIIAHINQPRKDAGRGVVDGLAALEARGFQFVWLDETLPPPAHLAGGHK